MLDDESLEPVDELELEPESLLLDDPGATELPPERESVR